jgi:predicted house-cleaning NTP pyrophosphatase (Maf/HAM1 superfamily)
MLTRSRISMPWQLLKRTSWEKARTMIKIHGCGKLVLTQILIESLVLLVDELLIRKAMAPTLLHEKPVF